MFTKTYQTEWSLKKKEKLYEEYPNGKNHIYNAQTSNMEMFNLDLDLA